MLRQCKLFNFLKFWDDKQKRLALNEKQVKRKMIDLTLPL